MRYPFFYNVVVYNNQMLLMIRSSRIVEIATNISVIRNPKIFDGLIYTYLFIKYPIRRTTVLTSVIPINNVGSKDISDFLS
jgi:hypothetical protein